MDHPGQFSTNEQAAGFCLLAIGLIMLAALAVMPWAKDQDRTSRKQSDHIRDVRGLGPRDRDWLDQTGP